MKKRVVTVDLARLVADHVISKRQAMYIIDWVERWDKKAEVYKEPVSTTKHQTPWIFTVVVMTLLCLGLVFGGFSVNTWLSANLVCIALSVLAYGQFSRSLHTPGISGIFLAGYYARYLGIFSLTAWIFSGRMLDHLLLDPQALGLMQKINPAWDFSAWSANTYEIFQSVYVQNAFVNFILSLTGAMFFRSFWLMALAMMLLGHGVDDFFLRSGRAHILTFSFYFPATSALVYALASVGMYGVLRYSGVRRELHQEFSITRREDLLWFAISMTFCQMHLSFWIWVMSLYGSDWNQLDAMPWVQMSALVQLGWMLVSMLLTVWAYRMHYMHFFRLHYIACSLVLLLFLHDIFEGNLLLDFVSAIVVVVASSALYWRMENRLLEAMSAEHVSADEDLAT